MISHNWVLIVILIFNPLNCGKYCADGLNGDGTDISSGALGNPNILGHDDADSSSHILDITQTDPLNTFLDYLAASEGVSNATIPAKNSTSSAFAFNISEEKIKLLQMNVAEEGRATLERMLTQNNVTGSTGNGIMGESRAKQNQIYDLNLKSVSLLNFGPYGGDRVYYPLQKRYITSPFSSRYSFSFLVDILEDFFHLMQHYTTLHYTTLHYTTLHYTTLHYTTLHYTTIHHTTLHHTTLHYTTQHYTTLQCANASYCQSITYPTRYHKITLLYI